MKYFILKWSLEKKQNNKTKRSLWCRLLHKMIAPLSANPDFDDKIEDVTLWFIEYDDVVNHIANREIGFAKDGRIIVKCQTIEIMVIGWIQIANWKISKRWV